MKRLCFLWVLAFTLVAPGSVLASRAADSPPATSAATTTAATTTAPNNDPTDGESWIAALAIFGAIGVGGGVLLMVHRAHKIQEDIGLAVIRHGGSATTATTSAAASANDLALAAASDKISITGPAALRVNATGEFTVADSVAEPEWGVAGIGAYSRALKRTSHTFVFTPQEQASGVKVTVKAGGKSGDHAVEILAAAAKDPFAVRLAIRNWGLILVATVIVFGAIALGVTGHLDGGNFVALVAPLAALLGVAHVAGGGAQGGDTTTGGTTSGSPGAGGGTPGGGGS